MVAIRGGLKPNRICSGIFEQRDKFRTLLRRWRYPTLVSRLTLEVPSAPTDAHIIGRRTPAFCFMTLSLYSALFAWLNIEWRFFGAPMLFGWWPRSAGEWIRNRYAVTSGFPFAYVILADPPSKWILIANTMIGIVGWLSLYRLLRRIRSYTESEVLEQS